VGRWAGGPVGRWAGGPVGALGRGLETAVRPPMVLRQQFCGDAIEQTKPDADRNVGGTSSATLRALDEARAAVHVDDRWTVGALHGPTSLLAPTTR
jgi:hypothetical protein